MSIDRVQVGRIFRHKADGRRYVRIDRLFDSLDQPPVPGVSFAIWDLREGVRAKWEEFSVLPVAMFNEQYRYAAQFFENQQAEMAEATAMREKLQADIEAALEAVGAQDPAAVAGLFVRLVQNECAHRIYTHDGFKEGCAAGCCDSTTDDAAEVIEVEITDAEREELLGESA